MESQSPAHLPALDADVELVVASVGRDGPRLTGRDHRDLPVVKHFRKTALKPAIEATRSILKRAFPTTAIVQAVDRGGPRSLTDDCRLVAQAATCSRLLLKA